MQYIKRAAILGCSNGTPSSSAEIPALSNILKRLFHIRAVISPILFQTSTGQTQSAQTRAEALMNAFCDASVDIIFDISGGDAANGILPFLDFECIRRHTKPFFGYSDLSVLLNPLHALANVPVFYFQPRFLVKSGLSRSSFFHFLQNASIPFPFAYTFLQGNALDGTIVGGNIRCTLKLCGTPWQPDFSKKILFLESFSGNLARIETMLWQYRQIGAFSQCCGILLGNFSELAESGMLSQLYPLVQEIVADSNLPIICTTQIGHQPDSFCLSYGSPLHLRNCTILSGFQPPL